MSLEIARDDWQLPPLERAALGPYADFPRLDNAAKQTLWDDYHARRAARAPVVWATNNRIFLLDPDYNVGLVYNQSCVGPVSNRSRNGATTPCSSDTEVRRYHRDELTFERVFADAEAMLIAQLRWQYLARLRHHVLCDYPAGLPDKWEVSVGFQNVYEATFFDAPLRFERDQVPDTAPIFDDDRKHALFDLPIDRPLESGLFQRGIEMTHHLREFVQDKTFFGRPITIAPYADLGTDGPLTVAMNLRGPAILTDLVRDPDYAARVFDFLMSAALQRRRAFLDYWSMSEPEAVWMADDSCALLSTKQYERHVLPHHRKWYDGIDPARRKPRGMHLCGDATRHFAFMQAELGISSFDTGFPVDFGALRRQLGPDCEIAGGVDVPLLMGGTPAQVYARAREILESGVLAGGRFIFREGNNLPPRAPWPNLAAMYRAAFDFGRMG